MLWGEAVLGVAHGPSVTAGARGDLRIASELLAERFPLLAGGVVQWIDGMAADVPGEPAVVDGAPGWRHRLGREGVRLRVGELAFVIEHVEEQRSGGQRVLDWYFTKIVGLSFAAHWCLVVALLVMPERVPDEPQIPARRIGHIELVRPPPVRGGPAGRAAGEEGEAGKHDAPKRRTKGLGRARESAVLRALEGFGRRGALRAGGLGLDEAIGKLKGTVLADAHGYGGASSRGHGPGGGGKTIGGGFLNGPGGGGPGGADLTLGPRERPVVLAPPGQPQACLNSEAVMTGIERAEARARYCYELALSRQPNLEGKVTTVFEIGPTGSVAWVRAGESTVNSRQLEACLVRVVQQMRFPPCKGGGTAQVTHPWIFKSR